MRKISLNKLICFICLILLTSCTTMKGPAFQPVSDKPIDKALVYLYWPAENLRTHFTIKANNDKIGTIKNGGYFLWFAEPGDVELTAKVKVKLFATGILDAVSNPTTSININLEAGNDYYVRCRGLEPKLMSFSLTRGQQLEMTNVTESTATDEIQNCKLME